MAPGEFKNNLDLLDMEADNTQKLNNIEIKHEIHILCHFGGSKLPFSFTY